MDWQRQLDASLDAVERRSREMHFHADVEDIGRVIRVGDGVAVVAGLSRVSLNEVVVFPTGVTGQVMDLDRNTVGCVVLGSPDGIGAGAHVTRTGQSVRFPVGEELLGRVIDVLGQPRDGLGPLRAAETWPIERAAPGPLERQPVREPLLTGLKTVDAVIPIGRGQRELILGDRQTGKTSVALDAIINQRESGVACVYVGIGQKRSTIMEIVEDLRQNGALTHTAVLVADASEAAALRYLAPYAGATLAEWFAERGRPALVVYDDLTHHAEAYRDLSLVLRHPPGREAYPGDIFSVHARLLERAFKLNDRRGAGSVTALPIVQTQRGNLTGFIPTNLISITDGQLYLDSALFTQGQLPAIDVGRSVSRVGRDAQPGAMQEAGANLRLEIAQYEDVKDFARFGAILDEATKRQLARGERITHVLAQSERDVLPLAVEVAELWALKVGLLDDVAPDQIPRFERALKQLLPQVGPFDLASAPGITTELAERLRRWITIAKTNIGVQEATASGHE